MELVEGKKDEKKIQPFMKWVGGKRQLLPEIRKYYPKEYNKYIEPMIGGGAVFFDLLPSKALINDVNEELILAYKVLKNDVEELILDLKKHKNDKDYFYEIREIDRNDSYKDLEDVKKVSRLIYLNRTCFNGLYRVNKKGYFNVPFGKYKNPKIVNESLLRQISIYLNDNEIEILNCDFSKCLEMSEKNDFIYIDPPYDPVSTTSNFTSYSKDNFDKTEQIRLKEVFDKLTKKGCKVLLSNSATDFIMNLYKEYTIKIVYAKRNINADSTKRGGVPEVLIMNY